MPNLVPSEHPVRVVWQDDEWRCELWVVNGLRRLRLFRHGVVVRDFAVATAQQALDLGASWESAAGDFRR